MRSFVTRRQCVKYVPLFANGHGRQGHVVVTIAVQIRPILDGNNQASRRRREKRGETVSGTGGEKDKVGTRKWRFRDVKKVSGTNFKIGS
jgi:hypothetical protein